MSANKRNEYQRKIIVPNEYILQIEEEEARRAQSVLWKNLKVLQVKMAEITGGGISTSRANIEGEDAQLVLQKQGIFDHIFRRRNDVAFYQRLYQRNANEAVHLKARYMKPVYRGMMATLCLGIPVMLVSTLLFVNGNLKKDD